MLNIIEKEIARRETLIIEKSEKEDKILELKLEIEKLSAEVAATDEITLRLEIDELKTYLPREEVATGESEDTTRYFG